LSIIYILGKVRKMTLGGKIRKARQAKKLTQLQLSKIVEVRRESITQYENDLIKPKTETLEKIANACDVDMLYFFEDEYAKRAGVVKKELKTNFSQYADFIPQDYAPKNMLFLPKSEMRIGAGSEGVYDLAMLQKDERKIAVDKAFLKGLDTKNLRIFEVVGDSMEPDFYEGDWAIADMVAGRDNFVRIAGVYIVRMDDVVYIKRVEFLPQNKIKLISLNPKYSDIYPHKEGYECEILGKVCGKVHCEVYKGLTFEDYGIK